MSLTNPIISLKWIGSNIPVKQKTKTQYHLVDGKLTDDGNKISDALHSDKLRFLNPSE